MVQRLPDKMCSREDMVARGAYGYLHRALERYVPLDKVEILAGDPACTTWANYSLGGAPVLEVKYSREDDLYLAFNAASVVQLARDRGNLYIRAFVEPDGKDVGSAALAELPKD